LGLRFIKEGQPGKLWRGKGGFYGGGQSIGKEMFVEDNIPRDKKFLGF